MTEEYIVRILENDDCITEGMIVRCRDCIHRKRQYGKDHYCLVVSNVMPDNGYCSMGESINHEV